MTFCAWLNWIKQPGFFAGCMWLLICQVSSSAIHGAVPEIRVATSAEEIFVGDSIDFQVEVRNVQNPPRPDLSDFEEQFDVLVNGDQSRNQSSITVINGRVSEQNIFSHVFQFRLTPRTAGELVIPPAKITVDGKTLKSSEIPLKVIAAEEQDLVLLELKSNHAKVYPTQPFTVTLKVLVQPLPNNPSIDPLTPLQQRPPHLQVNWVDPPSGLTASDKASWLQPLLADDGVGFTLNDVNTRTGSFFDGPRSAVFNLRNGRETREDLTGKKVNYFVYELSRTLTPEKTGEYSLGPALVKGTFVAGAEKKEYRGRRLVASAPAIRVEVREVPSPRPSTFCGGIGDYKVTASASPARLRVGDPLTLTLKFEKGAQSGSLEQISAPDLAQIAELTDDFDLIDKNPTGRVEGATKTFAYALRPRQPGKGLPPLTFSTFDPEQEQFESVSTPPIPLEVSEADRLATGELRGSLTSPGSTSIKSRAEGIFQNLSDPSLIRDQRISLWAYGIASAGVWCGAGALIGLITFLRRKNSDEQYVRRQQASSSAVRRMNEARALGKKGESKEALRQLRAAIVGLIADFRNRVADGLTATDVNQVLANSSVSDEDRTEVIRLLESIESAEYGAGQSANPGEAIDKAARLIPRISRGLEKG